VSNIRIVLTITEASPELYAALRDVPSRQRAERVRTLATLGLAAVGGGLGSRPTKAAATEPQHLQQQTPQQKQNDDGVNRAIAFAKALGDGV